MASESRSDLELLEAWRAGDRAAGDALFERHFLSVYRFFCNKLGGAVDDAVQATFLACAESRDRVRQGASFRTFVFAVARNVLYDRLRAQYRGKEVDFDSASVVDIGTTPSQMAVRKREQRLLLHALRTLPIDYQVAIELFYWEGLSGGEVAAVLDVPEPTARTRLRRGRIMLGERMSELADSSEVAQSTLDNLERWATSLRDYADADAQAQAQAGATAALNRPGRPPPR